MRKKKKRGRTVRGLTETKTKLGIHQDGRGYPRTFQGKLLDSGLPGKLLRFRFQEIKAEDHVESGVEWWLGKVFVLLEMCQAASEWC